MGTSNSINIENILDKTTEIICFFEKDGTVTFLNRTGRDELGFNVSSTNIRDILPQIMPKDEDLLSILEEKKDTAVKSYAYRNNHSCFPVAVRFHLEEDRAVAYISDLRDLVKLDKKLESVESNMALALKARDEFTANLTHELRTPVNGIKGHIRNLKEQESDSSKRRKMDIVLQCCDNMEKIINNLLEFAKLENGKIVLEEEAFSLHKLIGSSMAAIEAVANEKGLEIKYHIADNVPKEVIGDEFRLSQVINNLLNNAVKFTSSGHVALEVFKTRQRGGKIELTFFVIDTGIGINEGDKDKLFKSFTQVDGSITRKFGGTGLGLYVCKQIIELMGGSIEVESELNKGTTFIFTVNLRTDSVTEDETVVTIEELKKLLEIDIEETFGEDTPDFFDEANISKVMEYLEKSTICVELENWEKAEGFATVLKKLVEQAPDDIPGLAFRLLMNVRKEKQEESRKYLNELKDALDRACKAGE